MLLVVVADNPALHLTGVNEFEGVAEVIPTNPEDGANTCTGTLLLPTRQHVLTAGHCVSTAGRDVKFDPLPTEVFHAVEVYNHPGYRNVSSDLGYDAAIIKLNVPVPNTVDAYNIYTTSNELLKTVDVVGYGRTGTGYTGATITDGLKRKGKNRIDAFNTQVHDAIVAPEGLIGRNGVPGTKLAYDFDLNDGMSTEDAFGIYGIRANLGTGTANESIAASFDSGSPLFIFVNGEYRVAGVTSELISPAQTVPPGASHTFGSVATATRVSTVQCWINNILNGQTDLPPRVTAVKLRRGTTEVYKVPTEWRPVEIPQAGYVVRAQQLQTVPIAKPNQISITFNENVQVAQNDLQVYGLTTGIAYHLSPSNSFTPLTQVSPTEFVATWTFNPPLADGVVDQIQMKLFSGNITDSIGQRLDGDWVNPEDTDDPNASEMPSGNGCADGPNDRFEFHVNLIAPDFNLDGIVDGSDFGIWNTNKFTAGGFTQGDANGDGFVDGSDFNIWNVYKFTKWNDWPSGEPPQGLMGGGGSNLPSASWLAAYDQLVNEHHVYQNGQINQSLTNEQWGRFADGLAALLARI